MANLSTQTVVGTLRHQTPDAAVRRHRRILGPETQVVASPALEPEGALYTVPQGTVIDLDPSQIWDELGGATPPPEDVPFLVIPS